MRELMVDIDLMDRSTPRRSTTATAAQSTANLKPCTSSTSSHNSVFAKSKKRPHETMLLRTQNGPGTHPSLRTNVGDASSLPSCGSSFYPPNPNGHPWPWANIQPSQHPGVAGMPPPPLYNSDITLRMAMTGHHFHHHHYHHPQNQSQQQQGQTHPHIHQEGFMRQHSSMNQQQQQQQQRQQKEMTSEDNNSAETQGDSDRSHIPQNATEIRLLAELRQMGFTDTAEILNGIRDSEKETADEVMLFLVTQREEAEEARREDEVRLLSEEQKHEQSAQKERKLEERLAAVSTGQELSEIFPDSWILDYLTDDQGGKLKLVESVILEKRRAEFLDFLKMEKKSQQWYKHLPCHYFKSICDRLKSDGQGSIEWLPLECNNLRDGLYLLSNQTNGIPKLFVDAQPQDHESGDVIEILD
jgi:hypothetical protein